MQFELFKFWYINTLLMLLILFNNITLFLIISFFKMYHIGNMETEVENEFEFFSFSFESPDARFKEQDIDNEFFYTILNQEFYLSYNCRFFFDLYGGEQALDFMDFIDFTIYNVNDVKNYKNVYKTFFYMYTYDKENPYILYEFNKDYLNDLNLSYYLNHLNGDNIYNIARNMEIKNNVKFKQRLNYIQYKNNKINIKFNEKNK